MKNIYLFFITAILTIFSVGTSLAEHYNILASSNSGSQQLLKIENEEQLLKHSEELLNDDNVAKLPVPVEHIDGIADKVAGIKVSLSTGQQIELGAKSLYVKKMLLANQYPGAPAVLYIGVENYLSTHTRINHQNMRESSHNLNMPDWEFIIFIICFFLFFPMWAFTFFSYIMAIFLKDQQLQRKKWMIRFSVSFILSLLISIPSMPAIVFFIEVIITGYVP